MDNNGFMPNNNPVAPQPPTPNPQLPPEQPQAPSVQPTPPQPQPAPSQFQPIAPQPQSQPQPQPQNINPQPLPEQPQIMASTPAESIVTEQFTTPIVPNDPITSPAPSEKKRLPLIPIIASACTLGIIAIVVVVVLLMNRGGVSISSVRNYCNKNNLVIEEETNESPKAEYISCTSASKSGTTNSIVYTVLHEGSFDDYSEFSTIKSIASSMMTTLEDTDSYKKYYFDGSSYGSASSYLIMEDKAYITATGNESAIRAALIEIGYPDRNWATDNSEQSGQSGQSQSNMAIQRDTARRNDISRVDISLVQYQTNHLNELNNLPEGPSYWSGKNTFDTTCSTNIACKFIRDYMNTSNASSNGFEDPDGTPYSLYITENFALEDAITPFYEDALLDGDKVNGYTVGTDFDQHIIYVVPGGMCDGEKVVKSTKRHFVILYRLESTDVYCLDDQ